MKIRYLDKIRVIQNRKNYEKENVHLGDIGTIWLPEIRYNKFYVMFDSNESDFKLYDCWYCEIDVADIELVEEYGLTNEEIAEDLPSNEPWWCIVEDGFIKNLKGEKKNKIAYDYDS